jgi:hypothetical protein
MDMTQIVSGGKEKWKMQGGEKKMKPEGEKLTPRLIFFFPIFFTLFPFSFTFSYPGLRCSAASTGTAVSSTSSSRTAPYPRLGQDLRVSPGL